MGEHALGPSGPGTVVLDLGAGVGALVLYTPPDLDGREIEISRDDDSSGQAHALHRYGPGTCPPGPSTQPSTQVCPRGSTPSGLATGTWRAPS